MRLLAGVIAAFLCASQSGVLAQSKPEPQQSKRAAELVDINHASLAELMTVPGMTASWAGRIVRFRPYRTKQDLLDHGVVTSQVYDRIRTFIIAHHDKP